MPKRQFKAPLIGEPGYGKTGKATPVTPTNPNLDLDNMTFSELANLALKNGIPASQICGISTCKEHRDMLPLQRPPNALFQLGLDVLYCNQCFTWYREHKPLGLGNTIEL